MVVVEVVVEVTLSPRPWSSQRVQSDGDVTCGAEPSRSQMQSRAGRYVPAQVPDVPQTAVDSAQITGAGRRVQEKTRRGGGMEGHGAAGSAPATAGLGIPAR